MSQESHIDTRTPEQMYQQIYTRLIARGEAFSAEYKHEYQTNVSYQFEHEPKARFRWIGWSSCLDDTRFHFIFIRESDNRTLVMTKYSKPPIIWPSSSTSNPLLQLEAT